MRKCTCAAKDAEEGRSLCMSAGRRRQESVTFTALSAYSGSRNAKGWAQNRTECGNLFFFFNTLCHPLLSDMPGGGAVELLTKPKMWEISSLVGLKGLGVRGGGGL